ncbi:rab9 effector protein with kelch motifs isoform X1 [Prionailurus iriomotensis]
MKLLPVLGPGDKPRKATWSSVREYTLTPPGDSPCARVGHSCSYLPPVGDAKRGKVFIVGGADPSRSFSDVHTMDLGRTHRWDLATSEGLLPRYEHASFVPSCAPHTIWVFGGADQSGNRNCLQVLNPATRSQDLLVLEAEHRLTPHSQDLKALQETRTWTMPEVTSPPPCPRTFHTSSAAIGNQLYVFGGGERGAQPVQDVKLHVFDASMDWRAPQGCHLPDTLTWSQPETLGKPPSPRHGHVMVAAETKLFIHGGLAGDKFYDDLHCIDINEMKWQQLSPSGGISRSLCCPLSCGCGETPVHLWRDDSHRSTGHNASVSHREKQQWTLLKFDTSLPPGRLDHSMCVIPWPVMCTSEEEDSNSLTLNCDAEKGDSTSKGVTQGCHSKNAIHIDFKGDFNLWDPTGSRRNSSQIKSSQKDLRLLGGHHGVPWNQFGHDTSHSFNTKCEGTYIKQYQITCKEYPSLDSSTICYGLIWVYATGWLLAIEKFFNQLLNLRDSSRATNKNNFINIRLL